MTVKKTQQEVEDLMVSIVRLTLGIPATDNEQVRIPYGAGSVTGSAPMHSPDDSVCYVYVNPADDGYGQQHHISYINGSENDGNMTEVDEYTEEYAVIFSCYGQDSFDQARMIRDELHGIACKNLLGAEKIYLKAGIPSLVQTHELMNTQWVKRCDLTATFYAYVRIEREDAVMNIENVSITLRTSTKSLIFG